MLRVSLSVDCEVLRAPRSGIGVYLHEVLLHLPETFFIERRGARGASSLPDGAFADTLRRRARRLVRQLPGAYRAREALVGWPPVPDDTVFFGPNFLLPPWPFVRERSVVTVHDLLFIETPQWVEAARGQALRALVPSTLARASAIIVSSERTKAALASRYGCGDKTQVIPLGIRSLRAPPPAARENTIVCVGNIEPRKDVLGLLHAHRTLPAAMRRAFPLHIIGRPLDHGYAHKLALALDPPLSRWTQDADDAALACAYSHAALCVAPSLAEGYGLVPLEALAAGVPVLAADLPITQELCADLADYYHAGDTRALGRALKQSLETPRAPSHSARAALCARHDWATTGRLHAELFAALA